MVNKCLNIFIFFLFILFCSSCKPIDSIKNYYNSIFEEKKEEKIEIKKESYVDVKKDIKPSYTSTPTPSPTPKIAYLSNTNIVSDQERIIKNAEKFIWETETKGFNRSPFIDKINTFAGAPLGSPYCSSFVSYVLYISNIKNAPITAWSPSMVAKNNILFKNIKPADVFGLYFPSKKRIAHVGFVAGEKGNYIITIEANTSPDAKDLDAKSREGDGVFKKLRNKKLMSDERNKFSRYWKE